MKKGLLLLFLMTIFCSANVVYAASLDIEVPEVINDLQAFPIDIKINDPVLRSTANHFQIKSNFRLVNVTGWDLKAGPAYNVLVNTIIGSDCRVAENYDGESSLTLKAKVRDYLDDGAQGLKWIEVSFWSIEYLGNQPEYDESYYSIPKESQVAVKRPASWDYYKKSLIAKVNTTVNVLNLDFVASGSGYSGEFRRYGGDVSDIFTFTVLEVNRFTGTGEWEKSSLNEYMTAFNYQWFDVAPTVSPWAVPEYFKSSEVLTAKAKSVYEAGSTTKLYYYKILSLIESVEYNTTFIISIEARGTVGNDEIDAALTRVEQEHNTIIDSFEWVWDESLVKPVKVSGSSGGSGINLAIIPLSFSDGSCTKSVAYYEAVGAKVQDYFKEVSYGTLDVNVEVITDEGQWISVPKNLAEFNPNTVNNYLQDVIDACDDVVDFTKYDYDPVNGIGVVAFITPTGLYGRSSLAFTEAGENGLWDTEDSASVDLILSYEPRFTLARQTNNIRALAHEFTHILGKLIITVPQGSEKDYRWTVPDEYLVGNVIDKQSLMGKWTKDWTEKVHPDSYIKTWLGWLNYQEIPMDQTITVRPLADLDFGDPVYIHKYENAQAIAPSFIIFEFRDGATDNWDDESSDINFRYMGLYQVDTYQTKYQLINFQGSYNSLSPKVRSNPVAGYTIEIIKFSAEGAEIKLSPYSPKKTVVAKISPNGNGMQALAEKGGHEISDNYTRPDLDLHGYMEDGRHVGVDYTTGEYVIEVDGVEASGDLLYGQEWIAFPEGVALSFSVTSRDTAGFMNEVPEARSLVSKEEYAITLDYFDQNGVKYSQTSSESISPGAATDIVVSIDQNIDGTYTVNQVLTPTTRIELEEDVSSGGLLDDLSVDVDDSVERITNMIPAAPLGALSVGVIIFIYRRKNAGR